MTFDASEKFANMLKNFFGSGGGRGNDFVGQYVELGQQKLRIRRVLGEGKIIDGKRSLKMLSRCHDKRGDVSMADEGKF